MMLQLAQAADTGIDFAKIVGIGGPSSIATALLFWLGKLYFDARKEKREDAKSERESESGIVETTSALTKLVREQMVAMGAEIKALQMANEQMKTQHRAELDQLRAEHEMNLDKLRERIAGLEADNEQLRRERHNG